MKKLQFTAVFFLLLLTGGSGWSSDSFTADNFESFRPYNPIYGVFTLGKRGDELVAVNTINKKTTKFDFDEEGIPLGFLETRGGILLGLRRKNTVKMFWLEVGIGALEKIGEVDLPGDLVFHDCLVLFNNPIKESVAVDNDWVFAFLVAQAGEFSLFTYSNLAKYKSKTLYRTKALPKALYLQPFALGKRRELKAHLIQQNQFGKLVQVQAALAGQNRGELEGKGIQTARLFDTGGQIFSVYTTKTRQAFIEKPGQRFALVKDNRLTDIKDIKVGVYQINKIRYIEFYFVKLWGGVLRTGPIPFQSLTNFKLKKSKVRFLWMPPVRDLAFGYWGNAAGFYAGYATNNQLFFPLPKDEWTFTDVRARIKTLSKGLEVGVRWKFNRPVPGKIAYSYGLTKSLDYSFPEPLYSSAGKDPKILVDEEGLYYLHLKGIKGKQASKPIHIPVQVYYRLPKVVLDSRRRLTKNLFYYVQENITLKIKGARKSNFIYKYRLSPKRLNNVKIGDLNKVVDLHVPILNFRLTNPGQHFLYIAAFAEDGRLYSEISEAEIWTEGNRLTKSKAFNDAESSIAQLETLQAIIRSSKGKMSGKDRKQIRAKVKALRAKLSKKL